MAPACLSAPRAAALSLRVVGAPASRFRSEPHVRVVAVVFRPKTTGLTVAVTAQRRLVAVAAKAKMAPAAGGHEVGTPFIEEMRAAAMQLHSRDQARDGKKEAPLEPPVAKWQTTVQGYLRFLVDSKLVFETLEAIVDRAAVPWSEKINLQKELEFYEWEGDLSQMQQNVRATLNRVASVWSRAEKDSCLGEMEKAFTCAVDLRRHMFVA